ncbi:MAG: RIP metalloprotease RseP [Gemmatimonadota bacterium]
MSFLFTVLVLAVVLGVLVFVHEAGHFIAAKAAGIHVHRFSLGLGAPIPWLTTTRGGTEYSISWLPLGGYVKMATAEEDATSSALEGATPLAPVPPEKMFEARPIWARMIVILAGVTMNILFALAVNIYLAARSGEQIDPVTTVGLVMTDSLPASAAGLRELHAGDRITAISGHPVHSWNDIQEQIQTASGSTVTFSLSDGRSVVLPIHETALEERVRARSALQPYRAPAIGQVLPGLPAEKAGLAVGDTVLSVNGDTVAQWYDLVNRIRESQGRELVLGVRRKGQRTEIRVTPQVAQDTTAGGGTVQVGKIGAGVGMDLQSKEYSFGEAIAAGASLTLLESTQIVRTARGLLSGRISHRELGGPILIGQMAAQAARLGVPEFLALMAIVSVNLAVLNLLPIPVLDGGQFMFLLGEAVLRRPLSLRLRERLTVVGLVLIGLLMVLAFSNDIRRLFGG